MTKIKQDESLSDHINQLGITTGPKKLEIFRKVMQLRGVPAMGEQDGLGDDAVAFVKLFNPCGAGTWFITEWEQENDIAFGWCYLCEWEMGEVSLVELSEVAGPLRIGIEVDVFFRPTKIGDIEDIKK